MNFTSFKKMLLEQSPDIKKIWRTEGGDVITVDETSAITLKNAFFFLSLMFKYPAEAIYSEIEGHMEDFQGFFQEYGGEVPAVPGMETLQAEYISLFVNNQGFVPAAPYASCHLDDGLLMGDSLFKLKQMMHKSGFVLDESARELEDHVAILLEFCAVLIGSLIETKTPGKNNAIAITCTLLQVTYGYIQPMTGGFAANVTSHANYDFYKIAAKALESLICDADAVYARLFGFS